MLSNHENLKQPIDKWPSDWDELLAFLKIPDNAEEKKRFWKELVTTYIRSEPLVEESENAYEEYFNHFWLTIRPRVLENDNGLISAALQGCDIYIKNWFQDLAQDDQVRLLNEKTNSGNTALHVATEEGHGATVDILLGMGANVNTKGNLQETPLHLAAYNNNVAMLRQLLKAGADCQLRRDDGEMPIHVAVMAGAVDVVNELLMHDSKQLTAQGREGRTPFIRAAIDNKVNIMAVLLKYGDDINQINPNSGHGPIHIAAKKNKPAMIQFMIENGADINLLSSNEMTALCFCVKEAIPSVEAASVLLKCGADLNTGDPTPVQLLGRHDLEQSPKHAELKALFIEHGASFGLDGSEATLTK